MQRFISTLCTLARVAGIRPSRQCSDLTHHFEEGNTGSQKSEGCFVSHVVSCVKKFDYGACLTGRVLAASSGNENEGDGKGEDKFRKKTEEFRLPPPCFSFLDALGCSASIVLGYHLVQPLRTRRNNNENDAVSNKSSKTSHELSRILWRLLVSQSSGARLQILPNVAAHTTKAASEESCEESLGSSWDSDCESQSESDFSCDDEANEELENAVARLTESHSDLICAAHLKDGVALMARKETQSHGFNSLLRASELDSPTAHFNVGLCYQLGKGTTANAAKAVQYYEKAAAKGHSTAMYNLAVMLLQGRGGLPVDTTRGMGLLRQASIMGQKDAMQAVAAYQEEPPVMSGKASASRPWDDDRHREHILMRALGYLALADVKSGNNSCLRQSSSTPSLGEGLVTLEAPLMTSFSELSLQDGASGVRMTS